MGVLAAELSQRRMGIGTNLAFQRVVAVTQMVFEAEVIRCRPLEGAPCEQTEANQNQYLSPHKNGSPTAPIVRNVSPLLTIGLFGSLK